LWYRMSESALLAEAQAGLARRYPFTWPTMARLSAPNPNLCDCDPGAMVVVIDFVFEPDGVNCPEFAPSIYCSGCGGAWHKPWKIEAWEAKLKEWEIQG